MKPKQAKELTLRGKREKNKWDQEKRQWTGSGEYEESDLANPINRAIESILYAKSLCYWQAVRRFIEAIELSGYKVSITKDGKEYNV